MFSNSTMTPADLAAVTGNNNDAWGGNGIWWIILLFLVFGVNGSWGNSGVQDQYTLASDFATLQRQIDSTSTQTQNAVYQNADQLQRQVTAIGNGISSLGYDQLAQMNNLGSLVNTQGYETRNAITQSQINEMQNANALQSQMATCCCNTKSAIADVNYNMATQANAIQSAMQSGFCQTNYNNSNNTRDIVDSGTANTQAILAKLNEMQSNAQQDKIAELQAENSNLRLAASQQAQNAYLVQQLGTKSPIPSYTVANPYASSYGCPCNSMT